jgi:hypothetical protein
LLGFRGNDGTDFDGLDTAYPVDTNGLLFDVGTATPAFGQDPLFALWSNGDGTYGSGFTGDVGGTEHYAQFGSAVITSGAVPEPASWLMMLLGLGFIGGGLRIARRNHSMALTAA